MAEPMNEEVCRDLQETLEEIRRALKKKDADLLNNLSNHTIHISTIYLEKRTIYIAMIAYSLSKIIAKEKTKSDEFIESISKNFDALIEFLKSRDFEKVDSIINSMLKSISEFDSSFGGYVKKILEFAGLQKGSKIYEHGPSLSSVAEMLGISKWDLMENVGQRRFHDEGMTKKTAKERFEKIKKILGDK